MRFIKGKSGWLVFAALSFAPLVFWLFIKPLDSRFADWQTSLTSVGQIFGLVGMAMFSLNLVLSARLKWLEPFFNGLNQIYIKHHIFGATALILLLFHPLFLAARLIPSSLEQAALFFVPFTNRAVTYGIFALLTMIILLAITFYAAWPYERWKASHKFLGLAFFLASLHMFLIPSDVARSASLRAYMFSLVFAGLTAITYRSILSGVLVRKFHYTVVAVRQLNPAVFEIELAGNDKNLVHRPGQFLFASFHQAGIRREYHPFTISSSPDSRNLRLTVKNLGDYTADLKNLRSGAIARIEGPFGRFSFLEASGKKQVWIAGGIGITPFLSMARSLKDHRGYQIHLFYCTNTRQEAVLLDELYAIGRADSQLTVVSHCSDVSGRISAAIVSRECGGLADSEIFICGPAPMMKSLKEQFIGSNVSRSRLHSEEFALL